MAAFQIHDADGKAIPINLLDQEAAAFWGKEVHEKDYAYPQVRRDGEGSFSYARRQANWFDIIGRPITRIDEGNWYSGWKEVVRRLIERMETGFISDDDTQGIRVDYGSIDEQEVVTFSNNILIGLYARLDFAKPYIELINHWQAKGYKPVKVNEH